MENSIRQNGASCTVDGKCIFCNPIHLDRVYGLGISKTKAVFGDSGKSTYITPEFVPLAKLSYLIITKQHHLSFANTDKEVIKSLERKKSFLRHCFGKNNFGFLEHGSDSAGMGSCIDHAHVHAFSLPDPADMPDYLWQIAKHVAIGDTMGFDKLDKPIDILDFADKEYMMVENQYGEQFVISGVRLPKQSTRQIIGFANKVGRPYQWQIGMDDPENMKRVNESLDSCMENMNRAQECGDFKTQMQLLNGVLDTDADGMIKALCSDLAGFKDGLPCYEIPENPEPWRCEIMDNIRNIMKETEVV